MFNTNKFERIKLNGNHILFHNTEWRAAYFVKAQQSKKKALKNLG